MLNVGLETDLISRLFQPVFVVTDAGARQIKSGFRDFAFSRSEAGSSEPQCAKSDS